MVDFGSPHVGISCSVRISPDDSGLPRSQAAQSPRPHDFELGVAGVGAGGVSFDFTKTDNIQRLLAGSNSHRRKPAMGLEPACHGLGFGRLEKSLAVALWPATMTGSRRSFWLAMSPG